MENYSLNERIDRLAIAYVTSHYDVKNMSVEEYFEAYKKVSNELFECISIGQ